MRHEEIFGAGGVGTREAENAARRLARRGLIRWSEIDDLAQDISIECLRALEGYDVGRGELGAFLGAVAKRAASKILRKRRAARRRGGPAECSLDAPASSGDRGRLGTLGDTLAEGRDRRRPDRNQADQQSDRALDLHSTVEKLPPRLRQICRWLETEAREEVARRAGIQPGSLDHHIQTIRRVFQADGLSAYIRAF